MDGSKAFFAQILFNLFTRPQDQQKTIYRNKADNDYEQQESIPVSHKAHAINGEAVLALAQELISALDLLHSNHDTVGKYDRPLPFYCTAEICT